MPRGNKGFRPSRVPIDPTRAVVDRAALPPAELIGALAERASYSNLDAPAEALERALVAVYAPGQLELENSDGLEEASELLLSIAVLRGWVAGVRRELMGDYSVRNAGEESLAFLRATKLLTGLVAAKTLAPRVESDPDAVTTLSGLLKRMRVEAALTLVTAGSVTITSCLAERFEPHGGPASDGSYLRETLELFYVGIPAKPYPLSAAEAARVTEWFPGDRKGENKRVPHRPPRSGQSCPHCDAERIPQATMRQRHRRLRLKLAELIWSGLSAVELGYADEAEDGRRQTR